MRSEVQRPSPIPPTVIYKIAVTRLEAADMLSISSSTFDRWVQQKRMPKGVKQDGIRRWDVLQVCEAWRKIVETATDEGDDDGENPLDHLIG